MQNLEIERKYLIQKPEEEFLKTLPQIQIAKIIQSYTSSGARLRKWTENGIVTYIKTVKTQVTDITRVEIENEITKEEYEDLVKTQTSSLSKIRYRYPYCGKIIEIDIYPFWNDKAIVEIELSDENAKIIFPEKLKVIKEVTDDDSYKNASLSKV